MINSFIVSFLALPQIPLGGGIRVARAATDFKVCFSLLVLECARKEILHTAHIIGGEKKGTFLIRVLFFDYNSKL